MAHLSTQAPGSILDHYADVIEGGNAYNSGTSYHGIPGRYSADPDLRSGADTPLSADAAGSTTVVQVANTYSWDEARWVKTRSPGYWLLCTAGAAGAQQKARRITAWDDTTKQFTVDAFPAAPGATGAFTVLQGFKRIPNGVDIFDENNEVEGGYDRYFDLELMPGARLDWGGDGTATYEGELSLVLRLLKHGRAWDWRRSLVDNVAILESGLTTDASGQEHRDGTYIRHLAVPGNAPNVRADIAKLVITLTMRIVYRVQRGM